MKVSELMAGVTPSAEFAGAVTAADMVLAIDFSGEAETPADYIVADEGITEQSGALESDVREGMVEEYLERLLPEDWDRMDLAERRGFLRNDQFNGGDKPGTVRRTVVSAVEIWAECFGKDPSLIKRSDTYDIFGMLMRIGGWEKYKGNKSASIKRAFYGIQRCFVRR